MSDKYEYIIWLEIHIKLNSPNKLFCQCKNQQEFDNLEANTNVCPVCMAHPGALPVLNKEPLEKAILLGYALNCEINEISSFDRKSYFYPDSPLSYQITQLEVPTNGNGFVNFFIDNFEKEVKVGIERAHIEADAWKTVHEAGKAILDFNRVATPLVEIVTNPDFRSDEEVVEFLKELQRRVKFNNIGGWDLEKGQMRVDVNISTREKGFDGYGTRVEIKNMNSFGAIKRAIHHEFRRQIRMIEDNKEIDQETRGWDDAANHSYTMRSKEDALDYRYFPEPDLAPLHLTDEFIADIKTQLVVSPFERIKRYKEEYGFNKEYINALIQDRNINAYFENCITEWVEPKLAVQWISSYVIRHLNDSWESLEDLKFDHSDFVSFLKLLQSDKLQAAQWKQVIKEMLESGKKPETIIEEKWFKPVDSGEIEAIVKKVLEENPAAVEDIKAGKMNAIGFLVGQVMKNSQWKANPKMAKDMIEKLV